MAIAARVQAGDVRKDDSSDKYELDEAKPLYVEALKAQRAAALDP